MSRITEVREIYDEEIVKLHQPKLWENTLKNISQYYKIPFVDAFLINAQAANATTLATYDTWKKFGRYVNRGERSIAAFTNRTDTTLKYYFDISQTSGKPIAPSWKFGSEEKKFFFEMYNQMHGTTHENLNSVINEMFQNSLKTHAADINEKVTAFDFDSEKFSQIIADSAMSIVMFRCGAERVDFDFSAVEEIIPDALLTAAGSISSEVAKEVLLEIEHTLRRRKEYVNIQNEENQRSGVRGEGWSSLSENESTGKKESVNQGTKSNSDDGRTQQLDTRRGEYERVRRENFYRDSRESDRIGERNQKESEEQRNDSDGDRDRSGEIRNNDNGSTDRRGGKSSVNSQLQRAVSLEAPSTGRINDNNGSSSINGDSFLYSAKALSDEADTVAQKISRQIKDTTVEFGQLSLFDDNIEISETGITNSEITQDMIDYVLTSGSNERHSIERIVSQFEKNKGAESNAEFLRKEFDVGGKGFEYQRDNRTSVFSAWYDKDGITVAFGKTAHSQLSNTHITWEQAAERIAELLNNGGFATQDTLESAEPYTRRKLAETLWYLHQDVEVEYFIPKDFFTGGFEVSTVKIAEALRDKNTVQKYIDGMTDLIEQYKTNPNVLRFHYHKLPEMLEELKDLQLERIKFKSDPSFAVNHKYFISEDEKDQLILSGSNVQGGKFRINEFFRKPHTEAEKENFLKNEYGIGGIGRGDYNTWHDSKGLVLSKGTADKATMKWNEVASRISRMVAQNSYITQEDIDSRISDAKWVIDNADINDKEKIQQANNTLSEYGITYEPAAEVEETAAEAVSEKYAELLDEEVMRGSGYADGKFRIFDYYRNNKPNTAQFAEFLKSEYGTGGHNGEGSVSFVSYTDNGLDFSVSAKNGTEHISFTWEQTAAAVMQHIENHDYVTADDINDRIKQSEYIIEFAEKNSPKYKAASDFLLRYGVLDKNAQITKDLFDFETVDVGDETTTIKFDAPIELWERFSLNGLVRNDNSLDEIILETDGNENYFCIPDKQGYLWNKVNAKEVLTPAEMDIVANITAEISAPVNKMARASIEELKNHVRSAILYHNSEIRETFLNSTRLDFDSKVRCTVDDTIGKILSGEIAIELDKKDDFTALYNEMYKNSEYAEKLYTEISNMLYTEHEKIDKARKAAHKVGLPFDEYPHDSEEIFDPFAYNPNRMSEENYELLHKLISEDTAARNEYDRHEQIDRTESPITITCDWSESTVFEDGKTYSVAEFDKIMAAADNERKQGWESGIEKYGSEDEWCEHDEDGYYKYLGYDKTKFTVNFPDGKTISERQDIGDGYGGVLDYLSRFSEYDEYIPLLDNQRNVDIINELKKEPISNDPDKIKLPTYKEIAQTSDNDVHNENGQPSVNLKLGDKLRLDDILFSVTEINNGTKGTHIQLQDLSSAYPIFRKISLEELNRIGYEIVTEPVTVTKPAIKEQNFRYTENNYSTGAKAKYRDNVAAIRKLYEIEKEKRPATPEEQVILSKYVGWGGLSKAFDKNSEEWSKEYVELKGLLNEKCYKEALNSTLTSYYTDPEIIKPIFETLERFGFKGGEILDPSMGTGNFYSVIPQNISDSSVLHGIELDEITGRIARKLYPLADIKINGYERTGIDDNSLDVIIGNVPFGDFNVYDKTYEDSYKIHDYFFIKSIDKVKPGGFVAFITSSGTMDKMTNDTRKELAKNAELIGAVRLPNNAFKAIAGTEVTSDIIFLKKREMPLDYYKDDVPDWAKQPQSVFENGRYKCCINKYFVQHPDMILGDMQRVSGRYGNTETCLPREEQNLPEELRAALGNLNAEFTAVPTQHSAEDIEQSESEPDKIPAPENAKPYCFYEQDEKIYYCENDYLEEYKPKNAKALERIKGMVRLTELTQNIIDIQLRDYSESELHEAQEKLSLAYDSFKKKFGCLNDSVNSNLFSDDLRSPLLLSIETENEVEQNGETITVFEKSDIFTKATISTLKLPDHAESAHQALIASLNFKNKVDIKYISELCGKSVEDVISELGNKIYLNPIKYTGDLLNGWETAEEYLSGYVKDKLDIATEFAKENPELFERNVKALQENQPEFIPISGIDFGIGTIYIPIDMYRDFMYETFETSSWARINDYGPNRNAVDIRYNDLLNNWKIVNKTAERNSVKVNEIYGTKRMNAYEIMEASLNLKRVEIKDKKYVDNSNGETVEKYVLNKNETMLARERQSKIENAFKKWILADPKRVERIETIYNNTYNVIKPRSFDGSYVNVPGLNPQIKLRPHQLNSVARIANNGCTMLAHDVGSGKTSTMAAAGMYMRSIGMAKKPIYVVPKPIVTQWGREFMRFFPTAKILVAKTEDFEKKNRRRLLGKIATGDFDAVIIGQTQFEKLPLSLERQEKAFSDKIAQITNAIEEMRSQSGNDLSVKQLAATRRSIETKLEKLRAEFKKDNFITFEQLGGDYLFVDEAHNYKNLALFTKMTNVSGINSADSQRATDMEMKIRYMQEINNGGGVTLATGTPVSNTLSEMYVMQHYLQPQTLKRMGLEYFDNWASVYGKTVTALEVKPSGNGFRMKTRFSQFHNLPELANTFTEVFDIVKTADLDLKLPKIAGGKPEIIVCEKSEDQDNQVDIGMKRAEAIESGSVDRNEDNMLSVCTYMTKVALDPRIVDPEAEDSPLLKVNQCARRILELNERYPEKTQVIFCDTNVPKNNEFSVYTELKKKLVESGKYAENEVAFIHEATTDSKRDDMFKKVNDGKIKIIIGSTSKLGTGVNIQEKLIAAHHLDAPYRPADLEQRNGRIIRQGNTNDEVHICYYSTKGTFDSYRWQLLEKKQFFISQVMSGKPITRSCQDIDEATLTFSEMKAATTENPLIAEKLSVDNEVSRLTLLQNEYIGNQRRLKENIESKFPIAIADTQTALEKCRNDINVVNGNPVPNEGVDIIIKGKHYTEREQAGKALIEAVDAYMKTAPMLNYSDSEPLGKYRGLDIVASMPGALTVKLKLKGELNYSCEYSSSPMGIITRIANLAGAPQEHEKMLTNQKLDFEKQLETSKAEFGQPFEHEDELQALLEKQAKINNQLEFSEEEELAPDESDEPSEKKSNKVNKQGRAR